MGGAAPATNHSLHEWRWLSIEADGIHGQNHTGSQVHKFTPRHLPCLTAASQLDREGWQGWQGCIILGMASGCRLISKNNRTWDHWQKSSEQRLLVVVVHTHWSHVVQHVGRIVIQRLHPQ